MHRVGRTARMGRQGQALLLLRPEEDSYVKFLELRKIPLRRRDPEVTLPSLHPELTQLLIAGRDVMEKAAKAYVSYVRAYKVCARLCRRAISPTSLREISNASYLRL